MTSPTVNFISPNSTMPRLLTLLCSSSATFQLFNHQLHSPIYVLFFSCVLLSTLCTTSAYFVLSKFFFFLLLSALGSLISLASMLPSFFFFLFPVTGTTIPFFFGHHTFFFPSPTLPLLWGFFLQPSHASPLFPCPLVFIANCARFTPLVPPPAWPPRGPLHVLIAPPSALSVPLFHPY